MDIEQTKFIIKKQTTNKDYVDNKKCYFASS